MFHDSADKAICFFTESILILRILEYIDSIPADRHIQMHAGTIDTELRLWHKCRM